MELMNKLKILLFGLLAFSVFKVYSYEHSPFVKDLVFEDEGFQNCVLESFKSNETKLATDVLSLRCNYEAITSLDGIEQLPNLEKLNVGFNQLTRFDLSANTELRELRAYGNSLTELDISENTKLSVLEVSSNALTKLDISANPKLRILDVSSNQLTVLNTSANGNLVSLHAGNNQLSKLDLTTNTALTGVYLIHNHLTELNLVNNVNLYQVYASHNRLASLKLPVHSNLNTLLVNSNQLSAIHIEDVDKFGRVDLRNNPFNNEAREYIKSLSEALPVQWGPYKSLWGLTWDGNKGDWDFPY